MELTVVVPCRNSASTIGNQLAALSRQQWSHPWEVIVSDNGSTDASREIVEQYKTRLPELRLVDASARPGAAHARNVGAAAARGETIAFCDSDDEVGDGWLAAIGNALKQHDFVASRVDIEKLNPPEIARHVNHPQSNDLQKVDYPPYLAHASGTSLGVKREIHEKNGGFDESLICLEDTDYCFRLQLNGVRLHFLPHAVVHYRFKHRPRALFYQSRAWARHNVLMYKRYRGKLRLARPWRRHLRCWQGLMRRAPRVLSKETRPAWMKGFGTQLGLLEGALRYGVPPIAALLVTPLGGSLTILLQRFESPFFLF